jgi:Tol biopolymer transport system component
MTTSVGLLGTTAATCVLLLSISLTAGPAGTPGGDSPADAEGVRAHTITTDGGRLDWSPDGELLAFDRRGPDGYFDIYTMKTDGTQVRCLTCDKPELPNKSIGNPEWHPSGQYLVFQVQNTFRGLGKITDYFANPGAGVNNDVWVMDKDGRRFWRLTDVKPRQGGVLHPQFSRQGDRLLWAERLSSKGGSWGTWALQVADFIIGDGGPVIRNIRTLQPGQQHKMYESHGFSPDGRQILFSGNLQEGQKEENADIYLYDLASQSLKNLTNTMDEWDEHAHFSPDGRSIVWMTNRDQTRYIRTGQPHTDYWLMDADGSNKRRLTYFNDPKHPEYIEGGVTCADSAWSPDGRRLAAYLITDVRKGGSIVMLDLPQDTRARAAQPLAPRGLRIVGTDAQRVTGEGSGTALR